MLFFKLRLDFFILDSLLLLNTATLLVQIVDSINLALSVRLIGIVHDLVLEHHVCVLGHVVRALIEVLHAAHGAHTDVLVHELVRGEVVHEFAVGAYLECFDTLSLSLLLVLNYVIKLVGNDLRDLVKCLHELMLVLPIFQKRVSGASLGKLKRKLTAHLLGPGAHLVVN